MLFPIKTITAPPESHSSCHILRSTRNTRVCSRTGADNLGPHAGTAAHTAGSQGWKGALGITQPTSAKEEGTVRCWSAVLCAGVMRGHGALGRCVRHWHPAGKARGLPGVGGPWAASEPRSGKETPTSGQTSVHTASPAAPLGRLRGRAAAAPAPR